MIFSEEFIERIKEEPIDGVVQLCTKAQENMSSNPTGWDDSDYEVLIEVYALILELKSANLFKYPIEIKDATLTGILNNDCSELYEFLELVKTYSTSQLTQLKLQSLRSRFKTVLDSSFCYEFSQGDLDRIQQLINEMREHLISTKDLEEEHKQRLLRRLEKLQSEMHKKVSDLDRFWGLIGEAGVVLGKIGRDAKPIVDRVREIADIVWQTQARTEELPSGTKLPMLEHEE